MPSAELLIQFHPHVPKGRRRSIAQGLGCTIVEEIAPQGITVIRGAADTALPTLLARWRQRPEVTHAEPNLAVNLHGSPGGFSRSRPRPALTARAPRAAGSGLRLVNRSAGRIASVPPGPASGVLKPGVATP